MAVAFHTHTFDIPTATDADVAAGTRSDVAVVPSNLGTASQSDIGDFATSAQGSLADTAVQPGDLGNSAGLNVGTTAGTVAAGDDARIVGAAPSSRAINTGTGLTGGGNLSADRMIALNASSIASLALADSSLQPNDSVSELLYSTTVPSFPDVVRTAAAKLSDMISLLDVGGVGDGVADNSTAWAKAISKLSALTSGGMLYVPRGVYKFNTAISVPKVSDKFFEIVGDGGSTVLDISATPTGASSIYIGSTDPDPPANIVFRNLLIRGGGSTTNFAVEAKYAHSALFDNVIFEDVRVAVGASNSFAMRFSYCVWKRVGNNAFYSDTACHDLVFDNPKAYGVGNDDNGRFLQLDVASDNVVIREPNFENCRQAVNLAGGGSLFLLEGGYIEYCTVPMIAFGAAMYGARISDTWLAESPDLSIANMIGGEFKRIRLFNHKVSFAASSIDVASSDIKLDGTATFTPCAATTVSSFLNGATSDGTFTVRYSKGDGWVELGGLLNVPSMDNAAFVLPADYRPAIQKKFTTQSQSGNIGYIIVGSNGNVVPNVPGQATAWLDGVKFFCGK